MHVNLYGNDRVKNRRTWSFQRGKFRPRLTELAQSNQESDVVNASTEAFQRLPNIPSAIQALSVLKGVGVATASGNRSS